MAATPKTSVSISQALARQAAGAAQALGLSRNQLVEQAVTDYLRRNPEQALPERAATDTGRRAIQQGDLYWVPLDDAGGLEPGVRHPHVVIQADVLNASRLPTVAACALTSNLKRAKSPGNVLLDAGEGQLSKQSVVEVSKVAAIAKAQLGDYIGSLSARRVEQILAGMQFLQRSFMPGR